MAIVRYDPLNVLNQLQREVNRLFDTSRLGEEWPGGDLLTSDWAPAVDIKEEKERFLIHADLPGVEPKNIEITMENGMLTLKGERAAENKEETTKFKRIERIRGTFLRRLSLPDTVKADAITAKYKDGVLEVIVPKDETSKPRQVAVES
jgi:HSP20 family protein